MIINVPKPAPPKHDIASNVQHLCEMSFSKLMLEAVKREIPIAVVPFNEMPSEDVKARWRALVEETLNRLLLEPEKEAA